MIRLPPSFRRCFAALAALVVVCSPIVPLVHAEAMARTAGQCAHSAPSHDHSPASSQHTQQHQHGATCCDLCAIGGATAISLPADAVAIAPPSTGEVLVVAAPGRRTDIA